MEKGDISQMWNTVIECNKFIIKFFQIFMCFMDVQGKAKEHRLSQTSGTIEFQFEE